MSDSGYDAVAEAHETLESMGVDAAMPPVDDIIYDDEQTDSGAAAGYARATDALHIKDAGQGTVSTAGHELIHYNQVLRGVGRPRYDHDDAVEHLQASYEAVKDAVGEETMDKILPHGAVVDDTDAKIAALMYASKQDFDQAYEDTLGADGDANDFLDALQDDTEAYEQRMDAVLGPIARRVQEVDQLPIDIEGEADAYFWSIWGSAREKHDEVTEEQLYDEIYSGWDDEDSTSLAEAFQHYDEPEALLDALEQRVQRYSDERSEDRDAEEAAGAVIQDGLERFEEAGRQLGLRGGERDYVAAIGPEDYSGFASGDELAATIDQADSFREALSDVKHAFDMYESAYRSLYRDQAEQDVEGDDRSAKLEEDRRDLEIAEQEIYDSVERVEELAALPGEDAFVEAVETLVTSYVAVLDEHEHRRDDLDTGALETGEGREQVTLLRMAGDDDKEKTPVTNPISAYITEDRAEDDDRFALALGEEGAMGHLTGLFDGQEPEELFAESDIEDDERDRVELDAKMEESDNPPGYVKWLHENEPGEPDGVMFQ